MENSPVLLQESSPLVLADIRLVATDMDGTLTDLGHFTPLMLQAFTDLAAHGITTVIVTGRSTGWVQGLIAYLPIAGEIAENGGVFIPKATGIPQLLIPLGDLSTHRTQLSLVFSSLKATFPGLHAATDNPFRLTDWTFDIGNLSPGDLQHLEDQCQKTGWGFTYSSVQCHIRPPIQNKGSGLRTVLQQAFPDLTRNQVITVGDSPNDEALFDPVLFPWSVGVHNVLPYRDRLQQLPTFITIGAEIHGFHELVHQLCLTPPRFMEK
jgi:hydroxymethylpyrimidine pyrophosphatase-like HAD family hydrolase